jgi:hypothetical protein
MRRIQTWLCLAVLVAFGASAADAASAAEYELEGLPAVGRCVVNPTHTGEYGGPRCVSKRPGKGAYDFLAGPGPAPKFEGMIGKTALETVGPGTIVRCTSGVATGEYTGQKTASVTLSLAGCVRIVEVTEQKCQTNPSKEGEIVTQPLEGELGFIKGGTRPKVGLDLKLATPISFSCGALPSPSLVTVEGSVIGAFGPMNSTRSAFDATYAAPGGKQAFEKFESGVKDTLSLTRVTAPEVSTEQAGLTIIGAQLKPKALILKNEEPMEIKSK